MESKLPQWIIETHGTCVCGHETCIDTIESFDIEFRKRVYKLFGLKTGWVIFCDQCESLGIIAPEM
jgi:hypothetical protein